MFRSWLFFPLRIKGAVNEFGSEVADKASVVVCFLL
jgi:hypothetical protein